LNGPTRTTANLARPARSARDRLAATCRACTHFVDDPAVIEAWIPNLTMLGSAYSSARGTAGICAEFDCFTDPVPAERCASYQAREGITDRPQHGVSPAEEREQG
jgi:hypothetical protein